LTLGVTGTALESQAHADPTKAECFASSQSGQDLQRTGKLRDARTQLLLCSATSCPDAVRADCIDRVGEVDRAMPSIVFEAKDGAGQDLTAVKVSMDGATLVPQLEGHAIAVDPGPHAFTFETAGKAPLQKSLVIQEGEKDRRERIVLGDVPVAPAGAAPASVIPSTRGSKRTVGLIVVGVGIAGLGVGTYFLVSMASELHSASSACGGQGTSCPTEGATDSAQNHQNSARSDATIGFIALGAGAVATGIGTYLLFGGSSTESPATSLAITPAGLTLEGRF